MVARLTEAAYGALPHYDYRDVDGVGFLAAVDDVAAGAILFWLGRPETWIRDLVVDPAFQGTAVLPALVQPVVRLAQQHGSRAVAGHLTQEKFAALSVRAGAAISSKILTRYWLNDPRILAMIARYDARYDAPVPPRA